MCFKCPSASGGHLVNVHATPPNVRGTFGKCPRHPPNVRGTFGKCPRHSPEMSPHVPANVLAKPGLSLGPLDMATLACLGAAKVPQIVARACMGSAEALKMADPASEPQWRSNLLLNPASEPRKRSKLLLGPASEPNDCPKGCSSLRMTRGSRKGCSSMARGRCVVRNGCSRLPWSGRDDLTGRVVFCCAVVFHMILGSLWLPPK